MVFGDKKWMVPVFVGIGLIILVLTIIFMVPDNYLSDSNQTSDGLGDVEGNIADGEIGDAPSTTQTTTSSGGDGGSSGSSGGGGGGGSSSSSTTDATSVTEGTSVECQEKSECEDNNPCNIDACLNNECRHNFLDIEESKGECCAENVDCDDGNIDTVDLCAPDLQCTIGGGDSDSCGHHGDCEEGFVCNEFGSCVAGNLCENHEDCDDLSSSTLDFCQNGACTHIDLCPEDTDGGKNYYQGGECGFLGGAPLVDYCEGNTLYEYYIDEAIGCEEGCILEIVDCTGLGEEGQWICVEEDSVAICEISEEWNEIENCLDANVNGICDVDELCILRCGYLGYGLGFCAEDSVSKEVISKELICAAGDGIYEPILENKCEGGDNFCCCTNPGV